MNDICQAADLSPGAVYRYFRGKDDIIAAICDDSHRRDLELIESIKASGASETVMTQLAETFLDELDEADVRLMIDMLSEAPHSEHISAVVQEGARAIVGSFADFVRQGQAAGEINPDLDPEAIASVMCSLYHGFIVQQHVGINIDAERYVRTVMTLFRDGFFRARRPAALPPH
jgi:AcrR family transcriptional regulator